MLQLYDQSPGESVPVTKTPLLRSSQDPPFDIKEHARHILSCGTDIIQTKSAAGEDVIALVVRTGRKKLKFTSVFAIFFNTGQDVL